MASAGLYCTAIRWGDPLEYRQGNTLGQSAGKHAGGRTVEFRWGDPQDSTLERFAQGFAVAFVFAVRCSVSLYTGAI